MSEPANAVVPFLFVSGPPGVGKTTVSWEIFDELVRLGDRPALVDLDLLGASWPVPEDDPFNERLKATNLAAMWRNFHASGVRRLIAAGVIENRAILRGYADAVPGAVPVLCRLTAREDVLRSRILGRGREHGDDVEKLARRAIHLSDALGRYDGADFWVDTGERDIAEVARLVLSNAEERWLPVSGSSG